MTALAPRRERADGFLSQPLARLESAMHNHPRSLRQVVRSDDVSSVPQPPRSHVRAAR
jgi:hypothetical protein